MYSRSNPCKRGELNRYITVKTQYIGFHKYEDAPEQVAFLKNLHRHIFKVEAEIQVFHDDRELEFFMVQDVIDRKIVPFMVASSPFLGSCEMQAEDILWGLVNTYGVDRYYEISVAEDDENVGIVTFDPYDV